MRWHGERGAFAPSRPTVPNYLATVSGREGEALRVDHLLLSIEPAELELAGRYGALVRVGVLADHGEAELVAVETQFRSHVVRVGTVVTDLQTCSANDDEFDIVARLARPQLDAGNARAEPLGGERVDTNGTMTAQSLRPS